MTSAPWRSRIVRHADVAPAELAAHPLNFRRHPKGQADALAAAIDTVGVVQSVIVSERSGRILDGHLRAELALARGEPSLPAAYVDVDEDEERLILATFDPIGALAEKDDAALAALLDSVAPTADGLADLLASLRPLGPLVPRDDPGPQINRAEELREKWGTDTGQLWEIGRHRLLCGDAISAEDVARLMGGERIEMVWTDPPYGVAVGDKNKFLNSIAPSNRIEDNLMGDTLDEASLVSLLAQAFDHAIAHCLAGAAWYVAAPARPLHVLFGQVLKDRGIWRQTIQWVKSNATFAPLGVDYHWRAEPILYGWVPNGAHRYYGGRQQDTVWEIARPQRSPEHPTMKPVELVRRAVENSSLADEAIYDAFAGSGSTLVAAEQTGRRCYGMEIEPKYVAVALERLAGMGLTPRLVD